MNASLPRSWPRIAQKASGARERQFGLIADQQRLVRRSSGRELAGNDRSSGRLQRLFEVLGILHEHQVIARRRRNTSYTTKLDSAVSAQPGSHSL